MPLTVETVVPANDELLPLVQAVHHGVDPGLRLFSLQVGVRGTLSTVDEDASIPRRSDLGRAVVQRDRSAGASRDVQHLLDGETQLRGHLFYTGLRAGVPIGVD